MCCQDFVNVESFLLHLFRIPSDLLPGGELIASEHEQELTQLLRKAERVKCEG